MLRLAKQDPTLPPRRGEIMPDHAAQLVLDVDADDVVERAFRDESEFARPPGLEAVRPAVDDAHHQRIGLAADAGGDLVAGDPPQRFDLLGDGAGHAGHGEVDAGAELSRERPPPHE